MRKFHMPNTFTIIIFLIMFMGVLTWFLPAGEYLRVFNEVLGQKMIVPNTYTSHGTQGQGLISVFSSLSKGFIDAAEIISYVIILGGVYGVILKSGAIDAALKSFMKTFAGNDVFIIVFIMIIFSLGGSITGIWEETLAFYLIMIPLMVKRGFDPIVPVAMLVIGAITGVMASTVNPFATGIASDIAEITVKDGVNLRIIYWVISVFISILYVSLYAIRVKKDITKSYVYSQKDAFNTSNEDNLENIIFTWRRKIIFFSFIFSILFMMYGILVLDWWVPNMTALFLVVAILAGIIGNLSEKDFWDSFEKGARNVLGAGLVIGFARGIIMVAQDGEILDTILHYIVNILSDFSGIAFVLLTEVVQVIVALFIPSSSAQASLTTGLLAPLADLFIIPRHTIVNILQVTSSLANMITPTSGVLMAALFMGKIPWVKWLKFVMPLFIVQFLVSIVFLIASIYM